MTLTEEQISAISATERVCSTISLIGTFIIVATFIASPAFRKPINRLVFYASWGNMMANIATIISANGIHQGVDSSLCQFQGFLIQWSVTRFEKKTLLHSKLMSIGSCLLTLYGPLQWRATSTSHSSTNITQSNYANWNGNTFSAVTVLHSFQLSHTSLFKLKPEVGSMAPQL